jgi:glycosyltransferase involved in cell wall biosynthesis
MKLLFVFEFGLLHYRIPILEKISMHESVERCDVIHAGNYTNGNYKFLELKANIKSFGRLKIITDVRKIKDDYDVIVFSLNLWRPDWIGAMFSSRKAKYIFWGHGFGRENNYLVARVTKLLLAKWADAQIFYTENGRQAYLKHGIPPEKLFVAQNTLHIENSGRSDATDKTDLIYVGRIQERKGIDLLIKAFALVRNEVPNNVKIKIIGNGDIAELQRLAEEKQIEDRVIFTPGVFNEEELKEVFINAVAYVSPNHVGLGVVHSFSYGVPVITNRKRKHAPEFEYCDDKNSLLYEGDVEQLAESIKQICTNKELRRRLSQGGYDYYQQNLRSDKMVKGFLDAFDYVLYSKKNKVTA